MPRSPLLTDEWQIQLEKGLPIHQLTAGMTFFRVYFRGSRHRVTWRTFRTYGPTDARFDHQLRPPREQERGILYLAVHPRTAFAEIFQRRRYRFTPLGLKLGVLLVKLRTRLLGPLTTLATQSTNQPRLHTPRPPQRRLSPGRRRP